MYSVLHETDDATSVCFSSYGNFLPNNQKQLVVASVKCLKFYRFNPYFVANDYYIGSTKITKLECMMSFTLMAPIRGMVVIRLEGIFVIY